MSAILGTLSKLIAHEKSARSIGSVEEAEAFAAKIQELMFKHKLEMTDVEYAEQEKNEPVLAEFMTEEELTGETRRSVTQQSWVGILMDACAKANFCRAIGSRGKGNSYTVFGRVSDRLAAKALFSYLYEACLEAAPEHARKYAYSGQMRDDVVRYYTTEAALKRRFTQGFKLGFSSGVANRLRSQVAALKAGAGQQGLVRIDQLARNVDSKIRETFPRLQKGRAASVRGRSGYEAGRAYGGAIGLNSTKRLSA